MPCFHPLQPCGLADRPSARGPIVSDRCRPIFSDCEELPTSAERLGNRLTSPHFDFDTRSIGDDLLGQFFLSAWHVMADSLQNFCSPQKMRYS